MTNENCTRCSRPMVRHSGTRPLGYVEHSAQGKCRNCYNLNFQKRRAYPKGTFRPGRRVGDPDEVVIYRALGGEPLWVNTAELRQLVEILTRRGHSARFIAEFFGCSVRTVTRHRAQIRAAA